MTQRVLDLQVTSDIIKKAMMGNAKHCAIANAIEESDKNIAWARVTEQYIEIAYHKPEIINRYSSSAKVAKFIREFDDPDTPNPSPFRLILNTNQWISSRNRRMNQAKTNQDRQIRKSYAASTGQKMNRVKIDDVPEETVKEARQKNPAPSVVRAKQTSNNIDRKKYNQRRTASQSYQIADAKRQMSLP